MSRLKHVEPSINFGIINSITKLHLVGISIESSTMHGSMNIKLKLAYNETAKGQFLFPLWAGSVS